MSLCGSFCKDNCFDANIICGDGSLVVKYTTVNDFIKKNQANIAYLLNFI